MRKPLPTAARPRLALRVVVLASLLLPVGVSAQTLDARRLGMGGVTTSDNGSSATSNIAFRAVPGRMTWGSIPLPIGVVDYIKHPVEFDPDSPDFNVFSILDLVTSPPVGLVLNKPKEVSSDVTIYIAKDSLVTDLADVRRAIPENTLQFGGVYHLLGIGTHFGPVFLQLNPLLEIKNTIDLSEPLRDALKDAKPLEHNTRYGLSQHGIAQGAIAYQVGVAFRALHSVAAGEATNPDPRRNGTTSLYVGLAPKYLMGLGFGEIYSKAGLTTSDTLFGDQSPLAIDLAGRSRYASVGGPGGLGHGYGADAGAVFYWRNFELGAGVSDIADQIHYSTDVNDLNYDYLQNVYQDSTAAKGAGFTSYIPATLTVNVAKRSPTLTLAADVVAGNQPFVRIHVGAEKWIGPMAVRGGFFRDQAGNWQGSVGGGYRIFHSVGIDAAIATHSQGSGEERVAELLTSLTIY